MFSLEYLDAISDVANADDDEENGFLFVKSLRQNKQESRFQKSKGLKKHYKRFVCK